ncbi:MAG: hydroxymethylbilane synthase [Verrucomicrobiae bacterium]|nr:hydroxymethylbilane synthase [Verrucomicrobiae bacterium]
MRETFWIGSRGSALALAQAGEVADRLRKAHRSLHFDLRIIKTTGDKLPTASLAKSGIKGLFTRELERALLQNKIGVAVHSLKDLPTESPAGLAIAAVPPREDPRDVLVFKDPKWSPEKGGVVATSSLRRKYQLLSKWPKLQVVEIRGNVETRLRKLLENSEWDSIVLAGAGLIRLGLLRTSDREFIHYEAGLTSDQVETRKLLGLESVPMASRRRDQPWPLRYRWLSFEEMLPAPAQAAIALQVAQQNERWVALAATLQRFASFSETSAERSFLAALGGGCREPVASLGRVQADRLSLQGLVFNADGTRFWQGRLDGLARDYDALGKALAEQLRCQGAPRVKGERVGA